MVYVVVRRGGGPSAKPYQPVLADQIARHLGMEQRANNIKIVNA